MFGFNTSQRIAQLTSELAAISRSQAMIEFTLDGHIVNANDNFLHTMGYALADIVGRHHSMFVPEPERSSAAYRQFWLELGRGEFRSAVFKRLANDGREVWLQATYNPILDRAGKPIKVIKIAADVTLSRMQSADTAGQILAINRSQAVIEFEMDGTIINANENFLATMGYGLSEIKGKHHAMFVLPVDRESATYRDFWAALGRGEFRSGEFKRLAKGGREIWLQATYNPILDPGGRPFKVVKFGSDVTRARQESTDTLGQVQAIHRRRR